MKKGVAYAALCALTLAAPAAAEKFYVPVLGATAAGDEVLATKVRVAGAEGADLTPGRPSLIALEAGSAEAVSAWMVNRAGKRVLDVPAFSEEEAYNAGVDVQIGDLPRARAAMASLAVGAANLSDQTASCKASLFDADGILASEVAFDVEPRSLARRDGLSAGGRVKAVQVTCDQSFYPFAVAADRAGKQPIFAKGIGPNGSCNVWLTLAKQSSNGHYTAATTTAVFHEATKAAPKGIVCVKAPSQLNLASARFEWDVYSGPWSSRDKSGMHNLAYFFLDRYRSGVIGNINQMGPNKNTMKIMQNVGMNRGTNTNGKVGYAMQTGVTYHFVYTYNAANKRATLEATLNNLPVASFGVDAKPGNNQTLIIKPFGTGGLSGLAMTAEFGNYLGQHHPEEASVGWKYSGFKIDLTPKP